MEEKWYWLSDWAADLSLWEDDLTSVASSATHVFIPYGELATHLDDVYAIDGLSEADVVVAWGMGALLLMAQSAKRPKGQKWKLLSPYADFCDEESEWTDVNLKFMARQVLTNVNPSLNAYAESFADDFGDWQDDWMDSAKKVSPQALSDGLNYLATHKIENPLENMGETEILYGRQNTAVPPSQTLKLKDFLPFASFRERPKAGHWPPMLLL